MLLSLVGENLYLFSCLVLSLCFLSFLQLFTSLKMHFLRLYVAPGALIFVTGINAQTGQCYFPGGVQRAFGWEPCVDFVEQSICCPTGWTCFSNKLCVATDPSVVNSTVPLGSTRRGACTNPSGNTTVCGDFCQSACRVERTVLTAN